MVDHQDMLEPIAEPAQASQFMILLDILWDAYKRIIVVAVTAYIILFFLLGGSFQFSINWASTKLIPKIVHNLLK